MTQYSSLKRSTKPMKRSGFKRPEGVYSSFKPRTVGLGRKKRVAGQKTTKKTYAGSKLPKLKTVKNKLWDLCKLITRKTYGNVCYTSGKQGLEGSDWHTGHFIHSSLCSVELRYDLRNLRPQSYDQNINKNGNTLQYRRNLIRDHGEEYVEELETRNQQTKGKKYDVIWYMDKIEEYKALLK